MNKDSFEVKVIGSGAGASSIYDGLTSSSFMLCCNDLPFCLVDLGLGVGRNVVTTFGAFPNQVIVTHNHSDHSGDLPVVLRVELAQGRPMKVIAHNDVMSRLKQHRIAEHLEQLAAEDLAEWIGLADDEMTDIGHGLKIQFYPGFHSESSYGFIIYDVNNLPRLAYTGDSCLNQSLYQNLSKAEVFIIDARPKQNAWHANFDEVKPWLKEGCYILGHGLEVSEAKEQYTDLPLLLSGNTLFF